MAERLPLYPVSTSKFGIGDAWGRMTTPLGFLQVAQKIGDNAPVGAVFHNRRFTGEVLASECAGPRSDHDAHHLAARPRGGKCARLCAVHLYSWNAGGEKHWTACQLRLHSHEVE